MIGEPYWELEDHLYDGAVDHHFQPGKLIDAINVLVVRTRLMNGVSR